MTQPVYSPLPPLDRFGLETMAAALACYRSRLQTYLEAESQRPEFLQIPTDAQRAFDQRLNLVQAWERGVRESIKEAEIDRAYESEPKPAADPPAKPKRRKKQPQFDAT